MQVPGDLCNDRARERSILNIFIGTVNDTDFRALIKDDRYQVFLFSCPVSLPLVFASHNWFVTNTKGVVERWEIGFGEHHGRFMSWGHLDLDILPPYQGVQLIAFVDTFWWNARILRSIEGGEGSLAARMAAFIDDSFEEYPRPDRYRLLGPNSNTYAQWVLDHFPEARMKLPRNAVGKGFIRHVQDIHRTVTEV